MREREVVAGEAEVRGVTAPLEKIIVEGHVIEISLRCRISDAESIYGKAWDESLDMHWRWEWPPSTASPTTRR